MRGAYNEGVGPGPGDGLRRPRRSRKTTWMSSRAMTRGQNARSALAFVEHHGGRAELARVLARMIDDDRTILGVDGAPGARPIDADAWLPFSVQARLLRTIDAVSGRGDLTLLPEVGRFMAGRDIPTLFRPFLRAGRTGWIIQVATRVWRMYHSHGKWQVVRARNSVIATLVDHPESDAAFCATFGGWVEGALELSGGLDVGSEHPACAARGAAQCVFIASWTTKAHREGTHVVRTPRSGTKGITTKP
jgi:hypothetical protein